jgi:hypothetical protein
MQIEGGSTMKAATSRLAGVAAVIAVLTGVLVPAMAQGPSVSRQTWQGPNTTPGAIDMFQCIYEATWPCAPGATAKVSTDEILAKWQQALGGAAALGKISTRILAQRRYQDVGSPEDHYLMRYTKVRQSDRKMSSIMSHSSLDGKFLHWTGGCTPDESWDWPGRQAKSAAPLEHKGGSCEDELYFLYGYGYFPLDLDHLKSVYNFEYKGVHKVFQPAAGPVGEMAGGMGPDLVPDNRARDAHLVLTTSKQGNHAAWLYFDTATGLLLRWGNAELPGGVQPFIYAGFEGTPGRESNVPGKFASAGFTSRVVDFLQYRRVGNGTIMPFQFVNQGPATRVRGVTINVVDNAPIDDRVFEKVKNAFRGDRGNTE